jgi:hypothetical protein
VTIHFFASQILHKYRTWRLDSYFCWDFFSTLDEVFLNVILYRLAIIRAKRPQKGQGGPLNMING